MLVQAPLQSGTLCTLSGVAQRPSPPRVHALAARPSLPCRSMSEGARLAEPAGNLKRPAILGCLACVIADVRGLWLEIWSFAKRSAAACESGRTPWIQAAFTGWSGLFQHARPDAEMPMSEAWQPAPWLPWSRWLRLVGQWQHLWQGATGLHACCRRSSRRLEHLHPVASK